MTDCRLIIDSPKPGAENMAIDEAILLAATVDPTFTLRLYRWSEPTLSLGYFQPHADRDAHTPSLPCPCVRRHSGGGAIMHDHELTYSIVVPVSDRWSTGATELYQQVHGALIHCYREFGVNATLSEDGDKQPFLCFQRRSDGDILVENHKVTGSAQRRHRGALLQHGSILLRKSDHAPELPGISELGDTGIGGTNEEAFTQAIANNIAATLSLNLTAGKLTDHESTQANEIHAGKFGTRDWTLRR